VLAFLRGNLAKMGAEDTARVIARDATRLGRNPASTWH